jgi:hypothetical protein
MFEFRVYQGSEDGTIKIHTKPIEFSDISKNTEKFKRTRNEI